MNILPNFDLNSTKLFSKAFIDIGKKDYVAAANYIKKLPYGRNIDKTNLLSVLDDKCATCSTKHALLYQLAIENGRTDISLIMGMFKMDSEYAPSIKPALEKHRLKYIPEAHNYLLFDNQRVDYTNKYSKPSDFENKLIEEQEIEADQITTYKVVYHKEFLQKWLNDNPVINLNMNELWAIREECIQLLSQ